MKTATISIDGPAGSGKSTIARCVAKAMGFVHVDSGALYRGITWRLLQLMPPPLKRDAVLPVLEGMAIGASVEQGSVRFTLDGLDPSPFLSSLPVRENVSDVAAMPEVRTKVGLSLRSLTRFGSLVMEGRDIGTVVLPDANVKFYLDALPEERARRRCAQLEKEGEKADFESVLRLETTRDEKDQNRNTAPLRIPDGASVVDTTSLTVQEVATKVLLAVRHAIRPRS